MAPTSQSGVLVTENLLGTIERRLVLHHHPHGALTHFRGKPVRSRHRPHSFRIWSLRESRGGSHRDLRQLLQQRAGLLEIGSVKALGKPPVDVSQQLVRLLPFPLLVPEPTQTHGGS